MINNSNCRPCSATHGSSLQQPPPHVLLTLTAYISAVLYAEACFGSLPLALQQQQNTSTSSSALHPIIVNSCDRTLKVLGLLGISYVAGKARWRWRWRFQA
jgi:hypothetical protein